jgi:signal transduction histidine kinase
MTKHARRELPRRPSKPSSAGTTRRTAAAPSSPAPRIDDTFFRHIVSGMRNGVLAITRDGRVALINDEAYRIFGIASGLEVLGEPIGVVLKQHPDVLRVLAGVFDLHHLPNRAELRLRASSKVIGYTLAFVRDDAGVLVGAAMFFKDLTRVEQLEERERLRDRLAAVGQMAAVIAHEVKNPLAGIEVMAGLLRRKVADAPEAQAVLTDIIKEAKMANAIVQEVLDFVRPIRLQVERTSIATAVRGAIQLAETKAKRGNVDVDVQLPGALPLIQADEHQLMQLFTNLLMNAYEAMDGSGRITISGERMRLEDGGDGRDAVQVEIADNGPGMTPDVSDKVLDPFFTTKPQGSGLGLAIVKKIVDAHDGRLDLRTGEGQGTTIRVTLPVSVSDES